MVWDYKKLIFKNWKSSRRIKLITAVFVVNSVNEITVWIGRNGDASQVLLCDTKKAYIFMKLEIRHWKDIMCFYKQCKKKCK